MSEDGSVRSDGSSSHRSPLPPPLPPKRFTAGEDLSDRPSKAAQVHKMLLDLFSLVLESLSLSPLKARLTSAALVVFMSLSAGVWLGIFRDSSVYRIHWWIALGFGPLGAGLGNKS